MVKDLPIWIMEPDQKRKRAAVAQKFVETRQEAPVTPETPIVDDIKKQLREIRKYARENIAALVKELKTTLRQKYPQLKVKSALDSAEAVRYITEISDGIDTISINNSSVVIQELKPGLIDNGFTVINSYLNEYDVKRREVLDYWDLPRALDVDLVGTFETAVKMNGLPTAESKKYLALLGANSVAAEDGTVFFLEHFANIEKDLKQANKVVLVASLDKIVKTRQQAAFQTQCMGIFGVESIVLGIEPKPGETLAIDDLPLPPGDKERELHLIILDNGRSNLTEGKFRDLSLCIGCRACNKHCPIRHSFAGGKYFWTPRTYLNQYMNDPEGSINVCLHCEACRLECPLEINLPYLMWQAKIDHLARQKTSFSHQILGRPEILARLGTALAPIANWMMSMKLVRVPMEFIAGIDRKTILPRFHFRTFRRWFKKHGKRADSQ